ncbi:TetR family transcriptional regulator [Herbihabitans rhizosphaerae]|uniref:TetR family transcriptional regulator n=2 Tax=Herbihabitans rhizosphaerae TaxID=1872711 RepID=A0A4Q7KJZ0_9PSEU|nr:TetR family transcriptional regulator [Herbihabitans rhizosphaerae]
MTREQRRSQLLATAAEIIRAEGTDALTLLRLAERAGVSRPVVYDHFETREGLLMALYRDYDDQIGRAIRQAPRDQPETLENVVTILSSAYVDGVLAAGPECEQVYAALSGSPQTRGFRQRSSDFYVEEFRAAIEPFVPLSPKSDLALLTGMFNVVEGLSRAAATGRISRAEAISVSTDIVLGALRGRAS